MDGGFFPSLQPKMNVKMNPSTTIIILFRNSALLRCEKQNQFYASVLEI